MIRLVRCVSISNKYATGFLASHVLFFSNLSEIGDLALYGAHFEQARDTI
jgi:hypothetical protein